ncbi:hypothetical protein I7I50_05305 [Histoplasma capsulatum G186AR]|uniref:Uncharacterized protein n=1 Tax=Ajellomyces capsulatus TaxID=5037 RepID=A0A8H7Z6J8_AJECA|nr:hypothetical protein I7I52_03564 [Histoplasma capsulatum]QSS75993.1 hypothetical protein I7I50_05305 [Histoplasma capsulatum G186AR]
MHAKSHWRERRSPTVELVDYICGLWTEGKIARLWTSPFPPMRGGVLKTTKKKKTLLQKLPSPPQTNTF